MRPPPSHKIANGNEWIHRRATADTAPAEAVETIERETGQLHPAALGAVVRIMRDRAAEGLSPVDAAEHAGYSPYHFTRLFSATMRIPPGQYLTALRIDAAKRRLLATADPVIDIAAAVGFDSLSSFSRRFRVMVGTSPGAFRTLADTVAERTLQPFRLGDPRPSTVLVRPRLPADLRPGPVVALWIGWFPRPVPIGLPAAGALTTSDQEIALPLCPDNPWLLSFAVSAHAEATAQLIPDRPLVARNAWPVTAPTTVELDYRYASDVDLPLLTALPSLIR